MKYKGDFLQGFLNGGGDRFQKSKFVLGAWGSGFWVLKSRATLE